MKGGSKYRRIDISTKKFPNDRMLIDADDWEYLKSIGVGKPYVVGCWYGSKNKYAKCMYKGKNTSIHRLLMPEAKMIDHVNHNGLDNRRKNLRETTPRENQANLRKKGQSKYTGVSRNHKWGWMSQIKINGKQKHLGTFKTELEASQAYQQALYTN